MIYVGALLSVAKSPNDVTAPAPFFLKESDVGRGVVKTFINVGEQVVVLEPPTIRRKQSIVRVLSKLGTGWVYIRDIE